MRTASSRHSQRSLDGRLSGRRGRAGSWDSLPLVAADADRQISSSPASSVTLPVEQLTVGHVPEKDAGSNPCFLHVGKAWALRRPGLLVAAAALLRTGIQSGPWPGNLQLQAMPTYLNPCVFRAGTLSASQSFSCWEHRTFRDQTKPWCCYSLL